MKKTLITTALALSAAGFAFAQDASVAQSAPAAAAVSAEGSPVLTPMATGDGKIDDQLRALHKEMEGKIKAIRDEYQKKMKAIIGERKAFVASTTQAMKQERKGEASVAVKALQQDFEAKKKALQQEFEVKRKATTASSTEGSRKALQQEFETKMKALQQEFEAAKKSIVASSTEGIRKEVEAKKMEVRQEVRGTSTANPQGNAWGFFRRFFGQPKPATTSNQ